MSNEEEESSGGGAMKSNIKKMQIHIMITKMKKVIAKKNTWRRAIVHFMMTVWAKKVENSSNEQRQYHIDGFIAIIYIELFNAVVELLSTMV